LFFQKRGPPSHAFSEPAPKQNPATFAAGFELDPNLEPAGLVHPDRHGVNKFPQRGIIAESLRRFDDQKM
jgi:hypothetical protein